MSIKNLSLICIPFNLNPVPADDAWPTQPGIADLYVYAAAGADIARAGNDPDLGEVLERVWARAAAS